MSGLKNTGKRLWNMGVGKGYRTNKEIQMEKEAKIQQGKDKLFAGAEVPDAEVLKRNERRKAAQRAGSRAKTVLTDQDKLG
jgi:hypothetical protein